jgi:hypothetical protein
MFSNRKVIRLKVRKLVPLHFVPSQFVPLQSIPFQFVLTTLTLPSPTPSNKIRTSCKRTKWAVTFFENQWWWLNILDSSQLFEGITWISARGFFGPDFRPEIFFFNYKIESPSLSFSFHIGPKNPRAEIPCSHSKWFMKSLLITFIFPRSIT